MTAEKSVAVQKGLDPPLADLDQTKTQSPAFPLQFFNKFSIFISNIENKMAGRNIMGNSAHDLQFL